MSLDDPENWKHAEQIERGDPFTPDALRSIFDWFASRADYLSERARYGLARAVIADRGCFVQWFAEVAPAPRRELLQRDRRHELDSQDQIIEELALVQQEIADLLADEARLCSALVDIGSPYAPALVDRDARGGDEDDARLSAERAAEKAVGDAPRLAG